MSSSTGDINPVLQGLKFSQVDQVDATFPKEAGFQVKASVYLLGQKTWLDCDRGSGAQDSCASSCSTAQSGISELHYCLLLEQL